MRPEGESLKKEGEIRRVQYVDSSAKMKIEN